MVTKRTCPWCRSEIARDVGSDCPVCDRPLFDDAGMELREIDLVYESVVAEEFERRKKFLIRGTPIAALVSLGAPVIHGGLAFVFSLPLLMLAHGIALRFVLVREPRRLLGRRRRFFQRNIARGVFLILTAIGYSFTTIPVGGAIAGVVTFVGVTWLTQAHLLWSLGEERHRRPPRTWEKVVLGVLVLAILGILGTALAFALIAWKLTSG